ncbi:MAG: hypothetical protein RIT27_821 [Pseudomonadota bacterium]|jgi:uncharacterized membrane protein
MALTLRQKVERFAFLDALRGVAVWLMITYHFCYDLVFFKFAHFNLTQDSFWLSFRAFIVSLFLLIVGISLHFSLRIRKDWKLFYKRLIMLGLAATLVSISSYWLFGARFIYLGVLHFITIASILAIFFLKFDRLNLVVGLILILLGLTVQHSFFNQPQLHWLGMMTFKPPTEDFVPLIPWFGVVLIGLFVGKHLPISTLSRWKNDQFLKKLLVFSGRHSLIIYLIHQPILMGLFYGFLSLYR